MDGTTSNTFPSYFPAAALLAVSILGWPALGEAQEAVNLSQGKQLVLRRDMTKCRLPEGKMEERTAIYTVFLSRGYGGPGTPPEPEFFLSNDALAEKLQQRCRGVEFIVRDVTQRTGSPVALLEDLKKRKGELDGVLLVGVGASREGRDYRLAFSGLPTVVVYNLFEFMNVPYKLFATGREAESVVVGGAEYREGRILTASLDRRSLCQPSVSTAAFEDLVYKIKLIEVIKKLKESRILVVAPHRFLAEVDYQDDVQKRMPEDYNETYTKALKEALGVELVVAPPEEFF